MLRAVAAVRWPSRSMAASCRASRAPASRACLAGGEEDVTNSASTYCMAGMACKEQVKDGLALREIEAQAGRGN